MNKKEIFEKLKNLNCADIFDSDTSDIAEKIREITDNNPKLIDRFLFECTSSLSEVDETVEDLMSSDTKYGLEHLDGNRLNQYESQKLHKIFVDYKEDLYSLNRELKEKLTDLVADIYMKDIQDNWESLLDRIKEEYIDD